MQRLLTGDRPTGKLHLGHYLGSIQERVRLQDAYESFYIIADLHVLTTKNKPEDIQKVAAHTSEMVLDQLACGIKPGKGSFYLQSAIGEVSEIYTLLQSLITVPRLQRTPSLKEMSHNANLSEMPLALLGYPVLQSADILCGGAHVVPVGKDNLAHIEITRELARRFNETYAPTFPVPEALISTTSSLIGYDGKGKMSKSLENAIYLSDDEKTVAKKIFKAYTDPKRIRADIPGSIDGNVVFAYHDAFNTNHTEVADLKARYQKGTISDVEVKEKLVVALEAVLAPIRERRAHYENQKGLVESLVFEGTNRMREEVKKTLYAMKKAMGLASTWNRMRRGAEKFEKTQKKD